MFLLQGAALTVGAVADVRKPSNIHPFIAFAPLFCGAISGMVYDRLILSLSMLVIAIGLYAFEYPRHPWIPFFLTAAGTAICLFMNADAVGLSFLFGAVFFLLRFLGEADALAILGCSLFSPSWEMLGSVWLGLFVSTLAGVLVTERMRFIQVLLAAGQRVLRRSFPDDEELSRRGVPALWGILAGFLFHLFRFGY